MSGDWRERRAAELRELWKSNPERVIGLYRYALGKDVFSELLPGLTLGDVIEAILDKEAQQKPEAGPPLSSG